MTLRMGISKLIMRTAVALLCLFWFALAPVNLYAAQVTCSGDLSQVSPGPDVDLIVNGKCSVPVGQNYVFHNINVMSGGTLQFADPPNTSNADRETDLYAESIIVQNGGSFIAGTLKPFHPIGLNGGVVAIHLWGAATDPGSLCLQPGSNNTFDPDPLCGVPSGIWRSNRLTIPAPSTCKQSTLTPSAVNDCFYAYGTLDDRDSTNNPDAYFGHKVLALSYGGTIQLFGRKGVSYCGSQDCGADNPNPALVEPAPSDSATSWGRLVADANVGPNGLLKVKSVQLTIDRAVDWGDQDHIVVTTTDFLPGHSEELVIQGTPQTTSTTTTINFVNALGGGTQWPHNANQYDYSTVMNIKRLGLRSTKAETRAAVALLSRSIRIVSDGATPKSSFDQTPGNYFGGHTIVRQGFLTYQVQGVEFDQLGQGGSKGHYPVHFHLTRTPPPDTYVKDLSINESMTRWVALHASQGVTVARVVGYKSIGHGFYLEDGTETNNKLYTNIGIFARGAVNNPQNPRQVPGILTPKASSEPLGFDLLPVYSDSDHPSVFWIMNGWNDFEYNMAAGAGTCGACYWFVPGAISGPSRAETWFGYAGEQATDVNRSVDRAGITPLQKFLGNSCTSAMNAFTTNSVTAACNGVNQQGTDDTALRLAMIPSAEASQRPFDPFPTNDTYWPVVSGGNRYATRCPDADAGKPNADCSKVPKCSEGNEQNCDATVLDGFTTSYDWAQQNFAAVWIRPLWALVSNSVVSDVLNAGVNFVTSGGYSKADVITGFWALARKTALIGSTQTDNPLASAAGPFNPFTSSDTLTKGLQCNGGTPRADYCMSEPEGISIQLSNWGVAQRLFSIYDGPTYQDSNALLNIQPTYLTSDGTVNGTPACMPDLNNGNPCANSGFMNGLLPGVRADQMNAKCYLPNAAIAWKQPNGFYYAPAFHSNNLLFDTVGIRHFVIEPLFNPGTFTTDLDKTKKEYCYWGTPLPPGVFSGYTDIDRETVLNDDDGSLTGVTSSVNSPKIPKTETISVNNEPFFNAPVETPECASDLALNPTGDAKLPPNTAKTSPYEYVTTAIYPECAGPVPEKRGLRFCPDGNWGSDCTTSDTNQDNTCVGIPLYRQFITTAEQGGDPLLQSKRMMGQATFQRSGLTVNHGSYYIDTSPSKKTQQAQGAKSVNVFTGGQRYDLFFLYAKPATVQTYTMYVGARPTGSPIFNPLTDVQFGYVNILTKKYKFDDSNTDVWCPGDNSCWTRKYDKDTGLLTLIVNMNEIASAFDISQNVPGSKPARPYGQDLCQPSTICQWNQTSKQCQCKNPNDGICHDQTSMDDKSMDVCSWSVKDLDCPAQGCPGVQIKLPSQVTIADDQNRRPAPILFSADTNFAWGNVTFNNEDQSISGAQCLYPPPG